MSSVEVSKVSADLKAIHGGTSSLASPMPQADSSLNGTSDRPETIGKEHIDSDSKVQLSGDKVTSKRQKRKDDKSVEHVLKALSSLSSPEEKLAALCKKYSDLMEENRQQGNAIKVMTKKVAQLSRERDLLQNDNGRLILAKDRLESLSRELQRQNKLVKDESVQRQRDEEERRKEVTARFQTTIADIQSQMSSHSERNDKLQADNKELTGKLTTLLEQYEKREESIKQLLQHKEMETKLFETKLEQTATLFKAEDRKHNQEKQALLEQLISTNTAMKAMQISEAGLKQQVAFYTEKYSEFESTLSKSNEVFNTYKKESEKMSKMIRKLEKDNRSYKQKLEGSNKVLIEMVQIKQQHEQIIQTLQVKNDRLEKLCRALQARTSKSLTPDPTPETQKLRSDEGKSEGNPGPETISNSIHNESVENTATVNRGVDPASATPYTTEDTTKASCVEHTKISAEDETGTRSEEKSETSIKVKIGTQAVEVTEMPAVEGTETPAVEGTETPAVEGTETPAVEETETPAVEETETPAVEETETPAEEKPELLCVERAMAPIVQVIAPVTNEADGGEAGETVTPTEGETETDNTSIQAERTESDLGSPPINATAGESGQNSLDKTEVTTQ